MPVVLKIQRLIEYLIFDFTLIFIERVGKNWWINLFYYLFQVGFFGI